MTDANQRDILTKLAALLVIGGLAEFLTSRGNKQAGFGLVYVVLLAYSITGNSLTEFTKGLQSLGLGGKQ